MKRSALVVMVLCLIIFIAGCTLKENVGIRGEIKEIFNVEDNIIGIYVEGEIEEDTIYDKANISINDKTKVFKGDNKVNFIELKEGQIIEVIFDGAVAESYPVQGKAKKIKILE